MGVTPSSYSSGATSFTWTGGVPNASITASASAVAANDTNSGFTITPPADTMTRTLKVYVGVSRAAGELHAYLSDNSATPYRDWTISDGAGAHNGVYTISYRSASANQTLYVTWANAKDSVPTFLTGWRCRRPPYGRNVSRCLASRALRSPSPSPRGPRESV